jgi:hypothetical protein
MVPKASLADVVSLSTDVLVGGMIHGPCIVDSAANHNGKVGDVDSHTLEVAAAFFPGMVDVAAGVAAGVDVAAVAAGVDVAAGVAAVAAGVAAVAAGTPAVAAGVDVAAGVAAGVVAAIEEAAKADAMINQPAFTAHIVFESPSS